MVRIEVFADPEMPEMEAHTLANKDFQKEIAQLIEQMKHLTADDMQDQVHRRFEFTLCRPCQIRFIINPLGKPRTRPPGHN